MYSCHNLLISSASGPYYFHPLLCLTLHKCSLGNSNFLEEISSLSHSTFSSISLHWSLRKAFWCLLPILWNSAFRCLYLSFSPLLFASLLFTAILPRKCTGHSKHPLPTTQEKSLHMDITRWSTPKSDWLYALQVKMEKLYTVNKNKTRSWLWLRSWTPYCQIQA